MLSQLRCPWCNAQGMSQIGSHPTKQAMITYCRKCRAIRGAIPLTGTALPIQADIPLRCPWCNVSGSEQVNITAIRKGWVVISCGGCDALHGLVPTVELKAAALPKPEDRLAQPELRPKPELTPAPATLLWAEIGNADLATRKAQYEAEMKRRAMMAKGGGTIYRVVADDRGAPYCLACRRDMAPQVVPPGYKNSGAKVWLCPNECGAWEVG